MGSLFSKDMFNSPGYTTRLRPEFSNCPQPLQGSPTLSEKALLYIPCLFSRPVPYKY